MRFFFLNIVLGFLLVGFKSDNTIAFDKVFPSEFTDAKSFLIKNKIIFEDVSTKMGNDPCLISSIVFPELMRYSLLSDFIETSVLELVYVQYGSTAADFSIGRFQMKPSFAETIELEIKKDKDLSNAYANLLPDTKKTDEDQRKMRVKNLKDLKFQLYYLNAFCTYCKKKFQTSDNSDLKEMVKLFSTAYNSGFYHSKEKLAELSSKKFYPYGVKYKGTQYAYSEVAQFFGTYAMNRKIFNK